MFRSLDIRGAEPAYAYKIQKSGASNSAYSAVLDEGAAAIIGRSVVTSFKARKIVVGRDSRLSSPKLALSLIKGLRQQGGNVDYLEMSSTDQIHYAVGQHHYDIGIEVTGSHTVKQINGLKIVRYKDGKVLPVARGLGMEQLREIALTAKFPRVLRAGKLRKINIASEFSDFILSHFNYKRFKKLKIVLDAGNGTAGVAYEPILEKLPVDFIKINFEPDGHFPNHEPDPIIPENIKQIIERVASEKADFGIAWDGDADRIAAIAPSGELVTGSFFAPMLLPWVLKKHPRASIIATDSMSHAVRDAALAENAKVIISPVGNSHVVLYMDLYDSPFAAEEADHFMFKETFNSESGIFPLLILLDELTRENKTFDRLLLEAKSGYFISGDENISVNDISSLLTHLLSYYSAEGIPCRMRFGNLEVDMKSYHFVLHPSYNDPVVRLNLEARTEHDMIRGVIEVKKLIREMN